MLRADDRTPPSVSTNVMQDGVYGTLRDIAYSRAHGSLYGIVAVSDGGLNFGLAGAWGLPLPDALIVDLLDRTNLSARLEAQYFSQLEFNRPSNSLFLPPEYQSVNCCTCVGSGCSSGSCEQLGIWCVGIVGSATIALGTPGQKSAGESIQFVADAVESPYAPCQFGPWYEWEFSDGTTAYGGTSSIIYHTFPTSTAGTTVTADVEVQCCDHYAHRGFGSIQLALACGDAGYSFHRNTFGPRSSSRRSALGFQTIGKKFKFNVNAQAQPGVTPNEKNAFEAGVNAWGVSETVCNQTYQGQPSFDWNENAAQVNFITVADLGANCGNWSFTTGGGSFENITAARDCSPMAKVVTHEIGHMLGLQHRTGDANDIMTSPGPVGQAHGYHIKALTEHYP